MKKINLLLITFIILAMSGCTSKNTISSSLFPISLGIDYSDDLFHIYYLAESKNNEEGRIIVKGSGISLAEAESNLSFSLMRTINSIHIKSIIITKSVTDNTDFVGLLLYYLSDPVFTKNSYLYLTEEDLTELYNSARNIEDISLHPLLTTKEGIPIKTLVRPLTLINITSHYLDNLQRVYLPLLNLDDTDNNVYLESTCFTTYLSEFSLKCLSNHETKGLRWIDNLSGIIITPSGYETTLKGVVSSNKVTYSFKDNKISLKLDTSLSIASIYEEINPDELKPLFENTIQNEIINTYIKAKDKQIDIYNLKGYVHKEHNRNYDLEDIIDVNVKVTINTKSHH